MSESEEHGSIDVVFGGLTREEAEEFVEMMKNAGLSDPGPDGKVFRVNVSLKKKNFTWVYILIFCFFLFLLLMLLGPLV